MKKHHDKHKRGVAEPVQVYLDALDRGRLARLVNELETTKSDVLRRALEVLEQRLNDPSEHPALGIIGIAPSGIAPSGIAPSGIAPSGSAPAVARGGSDHDELLAQSEIASWTARHKRDR